MEWTKEKVNDMAKQIVRTFHYLSDKSEDFSCILNDAFKYNDENAMKIVDGIIAWCCDIDDDDDEKGKDEDE